MSVKKKKKMSPVQCKIYDGFFKAQNVLVCGQLCICVCVCVCVCVWFVLIRFLFIYLFIYLCYP